MPFGSYEGAAPSAYANAVRMMKETGAQAVKVESGPTVPETIAYLVQRGIPVMGHVGLRPQAVLVDGGFRAKGRTAARARAVIDEAEATADGRRLLHRRRGRGRGPGAARSPTRSRFPPSASAPRPACDGQILVVDDMLGLFDWTPKFVRRYADLRGEIGRAAAAYAERRARPPLPGRGRDLLRQSRRIRAGPWAAIHSKPCVAAKRGRL